MFNMGGPEIVVILIVALIVLGPQQLPKAMRTFGSVMAEIRKVSSSFQEEMRSAMDSVDTTGTEKPQSGSMASVTPGEDIQTAAERPDVDEIAARNDDRTEVAAGDDDRDEAVDARPAIDPADRAAG
jgi:sec-independent protein translocase protein TatB